MALLASEFPAEPTLGGFLTLEYRGGSAWYVPDDPVDGWLRQENEPNSRDLNWFGGQP